MNFSNEEIELLQRRIDDPDWDISQQNDVWEMLPRLLELNTQLDNLRQEEERADRLEKMVDRMSETISECVLLIWPMYDLCQQIEICGASEELTKAVTMASDIMHKLMDATGAKQLPPKE